MIATFSACKACGESFYGFGYAGEPCSAECAAILESDSSSTGGGELLVSAEEITPETPSIRNLCMGGAPAGWRDEAGARFDRWLAQHDREVRSAATTLALRAAARVLAAEFTPLTNRDPDWRAVHGRLLDASAFDVPPDLSTTEGENS